MASRIRSIAGINIAVELPSGWVSRELISIIDEYVVERLPLILNESLGALGLEASVRLDENECSLGVEPCEEDTFVVDIYSGDDIVYRAVYARKIGDNTYYLFLKRILAK